MTRLWELGALELAATIVAREATSREIIEAHLARIDAVKPLLNAVVRRLDDEALAADRAEAESEQLGPLHGVPFTVKENIDLARTPTTQGIPALADAVATIDAPSVERMRAAGAIPLARTNLPDVGLRIHTHSTLHGLTRNPWNASTPEVARPQGRRVPAFPDTCTPCCPTGYSDGWFPKPVVWVGPLIGRSGSRNSRAFGG